MVSFLCRDFQSKLYTASQPTAGAVAPTSSTKSSLQVVVGAVEESVYLNEHEKFSLCVVWLAAMNVQESTLQHKNKGLGLFADRQIGNKLVGYNGRVVREDLVRNPNTTKVYR